MGLREKKTQEPIRNLYLEELHVAARKDGQLFIGGDKNGTVYKIYIKNTTASPVDLPEIILDSCIKQKLTDDWILIAPGIGAFFADGIKGWFVLNESKNEKLKKS